MATNVNECGVGAAWRPVRGGRGLLAVAVIIFAVGALIAGGCTTPRDGSGESVSSADRQTATSQPAKYDTTVARAITPRDFFEEMALDRSVDFKLVDRLMDEKTRVPEFERDALPRLPDGARISDEIGLLDDRNPFPDPEGLAQKESSINVGLARSTYRTHEPEEVLAAIQPFLDLEQRQVNVRGAVSLQDRADRMFFDLADGKQQLVISHVFDYLLVRSWMANQQGNGTVLLGVARPAHPRTTALDQGFAGIVGTSAELIVRLDSQYRGTRDLAGARLALAANNTHGPGTFLTRLMVDAGHALDTPFFSSVTLRRYCKDAVIDVVKGRADVACVPQGTMGALQTFFGIEKRVRTLAVSPRYDVDVLYTSMNNVETHRTEIELTQRQLLTLKKDPEGQEVLFFFDEDGWQFARDEDLKVAEEAFADFLTFYERTPLDLRPLLDPAATVDRRTYDRFGDE